MSRYYDIELIDPVTNKTVKQWTSSPNGVYDPGALNVEFDLLVYPMDSNMGAASVIVEGVPLADLIQNKQYANSTPFAGLIFQIKGGMGKGLGLVNPKQSGVLYRGGILQSFGNWEGTEMNLAFVITPSPFTTANPGNFVFLWKSGTPILQAIETTLQTAFPNVPIASNLSQNLVFGYDEIHFCSTLGGFGAHIKALTQGKAGTNYPGISIGVSKGVILIYDYAPSSSIYTQLVMTDFIGQPTWIGVDVMQATMVLRGDIGLNSVVKMPSEFQSLPGIVNIQSASYASTQKYQTTFKGLFQIISLRHIGNFRSSSGREWATILNMVPYSAG